MKKEEGISHSKAHYLTTIQRLLEERGYARVTDIANALKKSKGTVSIMTGKMGKEGFIEFDDNGFIRLTQRGQSLSGKYLGTKALLFRFFTQIMGVPAQNASQDACHLEHRLSTEATKSLVRLMKFFEGDPKELERFQGFHQECNSPGACTICEEECLLALLNRADAQSKPSEEDYD